MNLPMYDNMRTFVKTPKDYYLDNLQALINDRWENSTQTYNTIYQQKAIGSTEYEQVHISVDTAIDIGTGFKKGDDFKVFSHKNISHEVPLGLYFHTDNDYWICINTNGYASPTNSVEVRRCNNIMKWVDPDNGYVHQEWCAIDYELSSPRPQQDKDVIVANGHVFVIVQGNDVTRKIRKNQRFIFNGQPYKIGAFQTMLDQNATTYFSTLLYIDMYLDTIQPNDDLVNNVANASEYVYTLTLQPDVTEQVTNFSGQMSASVMLNNEPVDRTIEWSGNDNVNITSDGTYTLTGEAGTSAVITACIAGNPNSAVSYTIDIVESIDDDFDVVIEPMFGEVHKGIPQTFMVYLYNNGERLSDEITWEYSGLTQDYFSLSQDGHEFTLSVLKFTTTPLTLTFSSGDTHKSINVILKPLF